MDKRLRIALLAVIVVAAAYTGASWAIGWSIQAQLRRDRQELLGANSYLVPLHSQYRRGVFESDEQITYRVAEPIIRVLRLPAARKQWAALQLTLRQQIHHGPWPQWHAFGLASIDSQLILVSQRAGGGTQAAFGGRPLVQVHTLLGWHDAARAQIDSAAFRYRADDGSVLAWQGLHGSVTANLQQGRTSLSLTAPGVSLQKPAVQLQLSGLVLRSDLHRAFDMLHVGQTEMNLARLQLTERSGTTVLVQGLALQSASTVNGDYIDQNGQVNADAVQVAQFSATRVGYVGSATHLHGPSLAALVQALREAQPQAAGATADSSRALAAFREHGLQIALHEPVLTISRAGFVMPEGELDFSAHLAVPGVAQQELAPGPAALAVLAARMNITADLRIDSALIAKLFTGSARQALYTAQIQQLIQQGYLRQQSGSLQCHLSYRGGRLLVNDLPFPSR